VKRRDLEKWIRQIAQAKGLSVEWRNQGRDAPHDKVRIGGRQTLIPRHREIAEGTARDILKELERGDGDEP
jgi:hypothetical protein